MIGGPGVMIHPLSRGFVEDGQFAPIDQKGILASTQGQRFRPTIHASFIVPTIPAPHAFLTNRPLNLLQQGQFFIQRCVRILFAGENEVHIMLDE